MSQEKKNDTFVPLTLSANDLQKFFGFHRSMAYELIQRPECGALRIGKRRFLDRDRFIEWLRGQRITSTKEGVE